MANREAERLFAEGVAFHKQGRIAEAAATYARACEADPAHLAARFNLAVALHERGAHDAAERAYKDAIALKPDLVQALNNLANLHIERGRVAEAVDALLRATSIAPPSSRRGTTSATRCSSSAAPRKPRRDSRRHWNSIPPSSRRG